MLIFLKGRCKMKRVILTICLLLVSGCEAIITEIDKPYHFVAWYQEGKTISQARRDCNECIYEVSKAANPSGILFERCMSLRNYQLHKAADLTARQIPIQEVKGWNTYGMYNDVADGTSWQD